jgi:hypothetical protein
MDVLVVNVLAEGTMATKQASRHPHPSATVQPRNTCEQITHLLREYERFVTLPIDKSGKCGIIFVVERQEMNEEAAMLDAAIAIRIHPTRAGAARRAIIVLRWPAWPKPSLLDADRREQRTETLDRALNASRNAALLNLPVVKGF